MMFQYIHQNNLQKHPLYDEEIQSQITVDLKHKIPLDFNYHIQHLLSLTSTATK